MSKEEEKVTKIAWHPAFCSAAEYVLRKEKGLSFEPEHNLSREPLRIDLLIIKKTTDEASRDDIAKMFRKYNVIEYKSPGDAMTIDDYYKTLAYAALYKAAADKVNGIPAGEITVSMFREEYPEKLMEMLKEEGCEAVKTAPGVYEMRNARPFQTQIIVMSELDTEKYAGLKILSKKATEEAIGTFIKQTELEHSKGILQNIGAILQVSVSANQETYRRIRRDKSMCEALRTLMKDEIDEALMKGIEEGREEGRKKGREEGLREGRTEEKKNTAINLFKEGMDISFIARVVRVKDDIVAGWIGTQA